jgi:hypothetical protein
MVARIQGAISGRLVKLLMRMVRSTAITMMMLIIMMVIAAVVMISANNAVAGI